jgi:hypothetical protein
MPLIKNNDAIRDIFYVGSSADHDPRGKYMASR